MKKIGAHVSVSGGVEMAPVNALGIGADAFALLVPEASRLAADWFESKQNEVAAEVADLFSILRLCGTRVTGGR